jgi:hypothetical protein
VHIEASEHTADLQQHWDEWVAKPAARHGVKPPELVILKSPYRAVLTPIVDYAVKLQDENPGRKIAVVLSELVEKHWYHFLLHNQRGKVLSALLTLGGGEQIAVVNVPWYLKV